jgi:hypothetical protein
LPVAVVSDSVEHLTFDLTHERKEWVWGVGREIGSHSPPHELQYRIRGQLQPPVCH